MLVPTDAFAGAERLGDFRLVVEHGGEDVEAAGHERRARVVGEHEGLLRSHRVAAGGGLVVDVLGGGNGREPLADVALGSARPCGQFCGRLRSAVRQPLEQPEFVADQHQGAAGGRTHVHEHLAAELIELRRIDGHRLAPCVMLWVSSARKCTGTGSKVPGRRLFLVPSGRRALRIHVGLTPRRSPESTAVWKQALFGEHRLTKMIALRSTGGYYDSTPLLLSPQLGLHMRSRPTALIAIQDAELRS